MTVKNNVGVYLLIVQYLQSTFSFALTRVIVDSTAMSRFCRLCVASKTVRSM